MFSKKVIGRQISEMECCCSEWGKLLECEGVISVRMEC